MENHQEVLPPSHPNEMVTMDVSELEIPPTENSNLVNQLKVNFPTIALVSGITLFIFMTAATIGLFGFILMSRPTDAERVAKIDLSRITSDIELAHDSENNSSVEVIEGSAPGLFRVESEPIIEVVESSPAGRVLPGGQTFTNLSLLPELPTSYYEARLKKNISANSAPPSLEHNGSERQGPQRVQFIIGENGNFHDHPLGTATFADTEIVGAAGEWQIRPWWQPAWVPQSVDCGEPGTAAIGGHVSWQSIPGPFHDLGAMVAGDRIRCQSQSGEWFTYEVSEVVQIGYNNTEYYWETRSNLNEHQLTLFTCKPEITGIIVVRAQLIKL